MSTHLNPDSLQKKLAALQLTGLLEHWHEVPDQMQAWIPTLVKWEEQARNQRSLERRLRLAKLGRFKSLADFDWQWPEEIDRLSIKELLQLDFIKQHSNPILLGPNGVGKTTIAKNIAHAAILSGYNVLFTTAANMLNDLAAKDGDYTLRRRLSYYASPHLLVIDELGYLSYGTRHADLLFEIVNRRYETRSTLVTTNKPFSQWNEVFPNAACVVSLVDRLIHHADILSIDGQSYRMHEAKQHAEKKTQQRQKQTKRGRATASSDKQEG